MAVPSPPAIRLTYSDVRHSPSTRPGEQPGGPQESYYNGRRLLTAGEEDEAEDEKNVSSRGAVPTPPLDLHSWFASQRDSVMTQEEAQKPWDSETELNNACRILLRLQKYGLILGLVCMNSILIWAGIVYHEYWYIFLPLLSLNTVTQVFFALCIIVSVMVTFMQRKLGMAKDDTPATPESLVMLLPCYNEDRQEVAASIESLVSQVKIDTHPRLIVVIVDGQAKAPGEDMTTQGFLLDDLFAGGQRTVFENGYCARDGFYMPVTLQHGMYKGVPYVLVGKRYNQGKRDSLCFVRSFLWHYRNKSDRMATIFNPALFRHLASIMAENGLVTVDYLCGMDGDTIFDTDCVFELIKAMRRGGPKVVGVCGAVLVKFDDNPWGLWNLFQNADYNMTQGLRREFQSRVTGKVNCLPGCCQLIRVQEATFGDTVLRKRFGHVPKPNDSITRQIMGVYSEDSIHASIFFSVFPSSQTRQALRARAFTTAPQSWPVYLSQRKRWTLGSKSNEFIMIFRPGIILVERLCSIITVVTWWIGPFIVASLINLFILFIRLGVRVFDNRLMLGLLCVLLFRYIYTFLIVVWLPHNAISRLRYLLGWLMYLVISPFMNMIIMFYSILHCDEFSWGKTRAVVNDEETGQHH
ncbi:hypothetical protein CDD81_7346 [Ophiocordyceps australis]|uniref:chitin synthase n=1 Tax=Ophiocordyceps australis TaxID=1399860 RepID=A0A2C5X909_9HYPO|nr:hypothetical protein CDD81_7346 [Ophiocordyceps australis]